jgi:DNA-3-methyladenine glycosylase
MLPHRYRIRALKKIISTRSKLSFKKLSRAFFRRPAEVVARALVGKILVRRIGEKIFRARVVETEAYLGPQDLASHAAKGRTKRTEVLFGPAGRAYVYLIYGLHEMLNVVAGQTGEGQAVLIRAAEALDGWKADLSGPGRLTRELKITRAMHGLDITVGDLYFANDAEHKPKVVTTKRIGIDYAGGWKDAPLRFLDVSKSARDEPTRRRRCGGSARPSKR